MRLIARTVLLVFILTILVSAGIQIIALADDISPEVMNGKTPGDIDPEGKLTTLSGKIFKYLQIAGVVLAVIVLALYGVQWFLATPQQKAILQDKAWSYVIGAILIFGGMTIIGLLAQTFNNIFDKG